MIFTHVLIGVLLAAVSSLYVSNPSLLVASGAIGGALPDLDMLLTHRKTLHFPVGYSILSCVLFFIYLLSGLSTVFVLATGVSAGAVHSLMDVLGGGKEMRPWEETDDRAAFNHVTGEWISARRILYDGSFSDFVLATSSGVVAVSILSSRFTVLIAFLLVLSLVYVLSRKYITRVIPREYSTFSSYIQEKLRNLW